MDDSTGLCSSKRRFARSRGVEPRSAPGPPIGLTPDFCLEPGREPNQIFCPNGRLEPRQKKKKKIRQKNAGSGVAEFAISS